MAVITNGPMFAAQLTALDLKLGRIVARTAIGAGAEVIKRAWVEQAPEDDGNYKRAITYKTSSSSVAGEPGLPRRLTGASAVIYVGPGAGDDGQEPARYASVIEFGGRLGPRQFESNQGSFIPAQAPARRAFYATAPEAVDAVADVLGRLFP